MANAITAQLLKKLNQNYDLIIKIIVKEFKEESLNKLGVYSWCTLKSGKDWPLEKWIKINSLAPLKRAVLKIKASLSI